MQLLGLAGAFRVHGGHKAGETKGIESTARKQLAAKRAQVCLVAKEFPCAEFSTRGGAHSPQHKVRQEPVCFERFGWCPFAV